MEQFLRNYFTNLNPNATEAEILAFLQSQGFGSTTTAEGIAAINPMPLQTGGEGDDGGIRNINLSVGAKPPGPIARTLATIFAPPVGIAMNLQALADRGRLPSGLNRILGSRASGNVEVDLPTSNDPGTVGGSSFDSDTGGTFGTSTNDASTFSDYS
jgi:hypothetical protein